jgi:hypothetical protein
VSFGGRGLIRGVSFGGRGLIRGPSPISDQFHLYKSESPFNKDIPARCLYKDSPLIINFLKQITNVQSASVSNHNINQLTFNRIYHLIILSMAASVTLALILLSFQLPLRQLPWLRFCQALCRSKSEILLEWYFFVVYI